MSHNDNVCDLMAEHGQMKAALESIRDYKAPPNSARPIVAFASHARAAAIAALEQVKL